MIYASDKKVFFVPERDRRTVHLTKERSSGQVFECMTHIKASIPYTQMFVKYSTNIGLHI